MVAQLLVALVWALLLMALLAVALAAVSLVAFSLVVAIVFARYGRKAECVQYSPLRLPPSRPFLLQVLRRGASPRA